MVEKPTYNDLERKIKQLEIKALEYMRREREFTAERKLVDYGHLKRTISLMKINEELNREIKAIKSADKDELEKIAELEEGQFLEEEKSLMGAIAESIARLVERERGEAEIRKCRSKIEELIKQTE